MTMGDWIQGREHAKSVDSYRPWTGTLLVLHYFRLFLGARPGLPWRVGGCHECLGSMPDPVLTPVVHIMVPTCQNPQCLAVQDPIAG